MAWMGHTNVTGSIQANFFSVSVALSLTLAGNHDWLDGLESFQVG